jgi:hypothetical protein
MNEWVEDEMMSQKTRQTNKENEEDREKGRKKKIQSWSRSSVRSFILKWRWTNLTRSNIAMLWQQQHYVDQFFCCLFCLATKTKTKDVYQFFFNDNLLQFSFFLSFITVV